MESVDVLIIGNGVAGVSAALAARRHPALAESARVVLACPEPAPAPEPKRPLLDLPERTKLNHAFVGVDIHLEPSFPAPHCPAFDGVVVPTDIAIENTGRLLKMAAAVCIKDISNDKLQVEVANLATGHTSPAGFAFARELWVEVAVSRFDSGDDFEVVIGGLNGQPLPDGKRLINDQPGLKNFQKVLFSKTLGEVVLQNQAETVLVGGDAVAARFQDRVDAIEPGDIRKLEINLGAQRNLADVRRVRVRLRFRSLPVRFLEEMERQARKRDLTEDADRLRGMIGQLRIFDIAEDVRPLVGGADCK